MIATFNGWDELPEAEREGLEQWEEALRSLSDGLRREPRVSGSLPRLDGLKFGAHL
jgi:hypothetical protein